MADQATKYLEKRVAGVEEKVFGDLDRNEQYTKATDVVLGFNSRLGNVLGDFERAVMIMKRLDELESYLDPLYGERLSATPASLAAELVSSQEQLQQLAAQLDQLRLLAPLLDSEHIKGASDLRARLEAASERHLSQVQRLSGLEQGARQLSVSYGQAVASLAESLAQTEQRVARAEAAN